MNPVSAAKLSQVLPSPLITTPFTWVAAAGDSQRYSQDLPKKHPEALKHTHTCSGSHLHSCSTHTHTRPLLPGCQHPSAPVPALYLHSSDPHAFFPREGPLLGLPSPKVLPPNTEAVGFLSPLLGLFRPDISEGRIQRFGVQSQFGPKQ